MADNRLVIVLVLVIVVLAGVMIFMFLIKPSFDSYIVDRQVEAQNTLLVLMLQQVQQNGFVQLPVGNQTLFLAPFDPQQVQAPLAQ